MFSVQAGSEGHSDVSSMFEERLEAAEIASGLKPEPSEDQLDQILDTVLTKQSAKEEEINGGPKSPGILQQVLLSLIVLLLSKTNDYELLKNLWFSYSWLLLCNLFFFFLSSSISYTLTASSCSYQCACAGRSYRHW